MTPAAAGTDGGRAVLRCGTAWRQRDDEQRHGKQANGVLPGSNHAHIVSFSSEADRVAQAVLEDPAAHAINNPIVTDSIPAARIRQEVGSWDGVTVAPHRYGGIEFRVGRRELGHLHGSRLADLPFPVVVRNELIGAGLARPHHILPDSGWVSRWIHEDADVDAVIQLFRMNYDRAWLGRNTT